MEEEVSGVPTKNQENHITSQKNLSKNRNTPIGETGKNATRKIANL
jgi:hypothetical protein